MIKGIPITLGAEEFTVPPLSLGALEDLQERLSSYKGGTDQELISLIIDAAHRALLRNYPDMTREYVSDNIGLETIGEIMMAVMNVAVPTGNGDKHGETQSGAQ